MSSTVIRSRSFIRAVASSSAIPVSEDGFAKFWHQWWWVFVKGFHVLEFAVLTLLLLRSFHGRLGLAGGIALVVACLDEAHHSFVPGRGGLWTDVVIDGGGIALGLAVYSWFRGRALRAPRRGSSPGQT